MSQRRAKGTPMGAERDAKVEAMTQWSVSDPAELAEIDRLFLLVASVAKTELDSGEPYRVIRVGVVGIRLATVAFLMMGFSPSAAIVSVSRTLGDYLNDAMKNIQRKEKMS